MTSSESQLASTVLMVRPARFESNPLTAGSNSFQGKSRATPPEQHAAALREFDVLVENLLASGIEVVVAEDTATPHKPDAIFPNNWVSFHADGRVVLYPLEAENRRSERRLDIIERLDSDHGFCVSEIVDLSIHESDGHYLEGTGSLVLDRVNRVAYACLSTRTHLDALGDFAQRLDYDVVAFDAVDGNGVPIYHTNVLMNIGEALAVVCDAAIPRDDQRTAVLESLASTGHEVLTLDPEQLGAFAGNMLELRTSSGERVHAVSQRAFDSLSAAQRTALERNGGLAVSAIDAIEGAAGGSVRCMLAEVHLPRRNEAIP